MKAAAPARRPSTRDGAVPDQRDGKVARVRVLLELPEHRLEPRLLGGEQDRARAVLARQPQRGAGAAGQDRLPAASADRLDHRLRTFRLGVDDQDHAVAVLERVDLVGQLIVDRQLGGVSLVAEERDRGRRAVGTAVGRGCR